jgi:sigma-E factor negative regulatory protein RseC
VVVEAANPVGAVVGQRVLFAFREEQVLTGAFVVFILPLLLGGVGAVIGHFMAPFLEASGSLPYVIGALLFFLLALGLVRKFDRRAAQDKAAKPVIIEILDNRQS